MIERRNILDLIGGYRGRYHSCVLTCYSLDFSFFEERVLPTLRVANVKNVNVLADGHYLEMAQEMTTGKEFKHNKTYNFQPIYEQGVFHPKIMLLTGKRHGLLIIGSGNMTSSGLSTNDEIWGAFHLDNISNENAPLFGAVWKYLLPYLNKSLGFVPQKIDWMRKHSAWLEELPITEDWIDLKSLNLQVKFIGNTEQSATFPQLTANIPNQQVKELTIISPYYDRSGKQLKQLKAHFKPQIMKCLVEPNFGLLPSELDEDSKAQIDFYSWADCKKDYEETYNRLHAKLVHFKLDAQEYLLLGSANATIPGMGLGEAKAANGEAGILLRRSAKNKNWIQELGISIPDKKIDLIQSKGLGLGEGSVQRVNYKYRVLYAEVRSNEITVYLDKECQDPIEVIVLNRLDQPIKSSVKETKSDTLSVQVTNPEEIFRLCLKEGEDRVSNYCIVHRLEALLRCNPDPNQEKLDAMMEEDFIDGEGITDLLQFVDYDWADEEVTTGSKVYDRRTPAMRKADTEKQLKKFEVLEAEEFNKVSTESLLKQSGELSNATVKIAEFLSLYISGAFGKEDDYKESQEQKLLDDDKQQGEGEEVENKSLRRTHGAKEKAAMMKYFKKLNDIYSKRLENFLTTPLMTEVPEYIVTIRSLSSILIALQLIQMKYGEKFTVLTNDLDKAGEAVTKEESFIISGSMSDSVDSVKGVLVNVLGKYLLLSSAGTKEYEYDILNQKINRSQFQFLVKATCLILNTHWRESEETDRDLLMLNCLYFSLGDQLLSEEVTGELVAKLEEFKEHQAYIVPEYQEELNTFKGRLLPDYRAWLKKFSDQKAGRKDLIHPTANLDKDNIIFSSKIGFNQVKGVTPDGPIFRLNLYRPGYPYVDNQFTLKKVQWGTKSILYS